MAAASRLRKSGHPRAALSALASHLSSTNTSVLNEHLYATIAVSNLRTPCPALENLAHLRAFISSSPATPNARTLTALLSSLRTDDSASAAPLLKAALSVVDTFPAHPDPYALGHIFALCASASDADTASIVADAHGGIEGLEPVAATALVAAYARIGDVQRAGDAFDKLVERGVGVNERTYAAIISAFARNGLHGHVVRCTDMALSADGVRLNGFVFSGALSSCARVGDAHNGRRFYEELLKAGVKPTPEAVGCLLDAGVKGLDVQLGMDVLFKYMRAGGLGATRDQVSKVIAMCGRAGAGGGGGKEHIMTLLNSMASKLGVIPDLGTYNVVIAALGRTKNMTTARYLVEVLMPKAGIQPNVLTYNALIQACGVVGNVYASFDLLHRMREIVVWPNQITFNTVLDQAVREQELELVKLVLREINLTEGIDIDSKIVMSLLQLYRSQRNSAAAIDVVRRVKQRDAATLDASVFDALIKICFDCGAEAYGAGVVGMLLITNRATVVTFNTLVSYFGLKQKDPVRASAIFGRMKLRGIAPTTVTYTTLIAACAKYGRLESAFRFLAEMQDVGLGACDTFAWTAIIDGCGKSGQWSRALEILSYMRKGGREGGAGLALYGLVPAPSAATYNAAIYAAGVGGGGWDATWDVFQLMKADTVVRPDHITFSALASAALDHASDVKRVADVEEVVVGLRAEAEILKGEDEGGKIEAKNRRKSLRRIGAKTKRLQWLAANFEERDSIKDGGNNGDEEEEE